jgi:hypothetical protein
VLYLLSYQKVKCHKNTRKGNEIVLTKKQQSCRMRNHELATQRYHNMNLAVVSAILNFSGLQPCKGNAAETEHSLLHRMLQSSCLGRCCNAPSV